MKWLTSLLCVLFLASMIAVPCGCGGSMESEAIDTEGYDESADMTDDEMSDDEGGDDGGGEID